MKKIVVIGSLVVLTAIILVCIFPLEKYDTDWIIGKTEAQVIEKYGEFVQYERESFKGGRVEYVGSYIIEERRKGFLGTRPTKYLRIRFNSEGVAFKCYEGFSPSET